MTTSKTGGEEFDVYIPGDEKRMKDFYKILTRITDEYALEYAGTNHLILHDKGTGERIDLKSLLTILRWCVLYIADFFSEDNVPLSKLYYLPMALIRRASDEAMARELEANGRK